MSDLRKLAKVFKEWKKAGPCALATVLKIEGSAYRRPGARMLINSFGETVGSISGGCLEADVVMQSREVVLKKGKSLRLLYNDATSEDVTFGVGAGCDGIVHVVIEPLSENDPFNPLECFDRCVANNLSGLLYTAIGFDELGEKCVLRRAFIGTGEIAFNDAWQPGLKSIVERDASELLDAELARLPATKSYLVEDGTFDGLIERFDANKRLFVFGAGPDVPPLVQLAANLGWLVTVVDHRRHFLSSERFSDIENLFERAIEEPLGNLPLDSASYALVMAHSLQSDQSNLKKLLASDCCYIGVLGPRRRTVKMLDDLRFQGNSIPESRLKALHYPVGLDLGAETPEEIALSIMAEIEALRKGHTGLPLKDQDGPIHRPVHMRALGS